MHEFSLVKKEVERIKDKIGPKKVAKVTFVLGKLAHGTPESIKQAFKVASIDTNLEGAKVEVIVKEPELKCLSCNNLFKVTGELKLSCPKCDSTSNEIVSGEECYVESIELAK